MMLDPLLSRTYIWNSVKTNYLTIERENLAMLMILSYAYQQNLQIRLNHIKLCPHDSLAWNKTNFFSF